MAELKFLNIGILSWITFLPLAASLVIFIIPGNETKNIKRTAVSSAFIQLLLSLILWAFFNNSLNGFNTLSSLQFIEKWNWINITGPYIHNSINIEYFLGADGLSLPMIILTSLLAFICLSFTNYSGKSVKAYFILILFLDTCLIGSFASMDFFLFFIFSASAIIPVYLLTGIYGGDNRIKASSEFLIQSFSGSIIIFIVMLALFYSYAGSVPGSHSFSIISLSDFKNTISNSFLSGYQSKYRLFAFAGLIIGFTLRLPVFPFHSRIVEVLKETPSSLSAFIAGSFIASGLYSLLRIAFPVFPDAAVYFAYILSVLGIVSLFYGAFCAIAQNDIKRAIAYYSISASGLILTGIASITVRGITGAILQIFNTGLIISLLFLITQIIESRAISLKSGEISGLSKRMPLLFIVSLIAFFAAASMPGLNNFISESFILSGVLMVKDLKVLSIISIIGIIITSVYLIWLSSRIFFGKQSGNLEFVNDISVKEAALLLPSIVLIILLGIYPAILSGIISQASAGLSDYISSGSNLMRTGW